MLENRHTARLFLSLAFLLLLVPGIAYGGDGSTTPNDEASCHVFVEVDANIAVAVLVPHLNLGSIQTGEFSGTIPFRVDANTEQVRISGEVTKLYKGDIPDTVIVPPINILPFSTLQIIPHMGNPTGGEDNHAKYNRLAVIDGFYGFGTESIVFESAQNNHFSQQVDLVASWLQDDPEKPMGEYSGKVKMFAEVVP
jgi:hypothetical protein